MPIVDLYHVFTEDYGEWDVFFDGADNIVTYWHCNDANWRPEYMNPLVEYFSGRINEISSDSKEGKRLLRIARKELDW